MCQVWRTYTWYFLLNLNSVELFIAVSSKRLGYHPPTRSTVFLNIPLPPEFLPVSGLLTRWCASTLSAAMLCMDGLSTAVINLHFLTICFGYCTRNSGNEKLYPKLFENYPKSPNIWKVMSLDSELLEIKWPRFFLVNLDLKRNGPHSKEKWQMETETKSHFQFLWQSPWNWSKPVLFASTWQTSRGLSWYLFDEDNFYLNVNNSNIAR